MLRVSRRTIAAMFAGVAMLTGGSASAAEITVFCTQALRTSLLELAPRFETATGHKVDAGSGAVRSIW